MRLAIDMIPRGVDVESRLANAQILDWYKKSTGQDYTAETDPGVKSVQKIFK